MADRHRLDIHLQMPRRNSSAGDRVSPTLGHGVHIRQSAPFPYSVRNDNQVGAMEVTQSNQIEQEHSDSEASILSLSSTSAVGVLDISDCHQSGAKGMPTLQSISNSEPATTLSTGRNEEPDCVEKKRLCLSQRPLCNDSNFKRSKPSPDEQLASPIVKRSNEQNPSSDISSTAQVSAPTSTTTKKRSLDAAYKARPFHARADAQLRQYVAFATLKNIDLEDYWLTVAGCMKRSVENVKEKWAVLQTQVQGSQVQLLGSNLQDATNSAPTGNRSSCSSGSSSSTCPASWSNVPSSIGKYDFRTQSYSVAGQPPTLSLTPKTVTAPTSVTSKKPTRCPVAAYKARPFHARADAQLLQYVEFAIRKNIDLDSYWLTVARCMERSVENVIARWAVLQAQERDSQMQQIVRNLEGAPSSVATSDSCNSSSGSASSDGPASWPSLLSSSRNCDFSTPHNSAAELPPTLSLAGSANTSHTELSSAGKVAEVIGYSVASQSTILLSGPVPGTINEIESASVIGDTSGTNLLALTPLQIESCTEISSNSVCILRQNVLSERVDLETDNYW